MLFGNTFNQILVESVTSCQVIQKIKIVFLRFFLFDEFTLLVRFQHRHSNLRKCGTKADNALRRNLAKDSFISSVAALKSVRFINDDDRSRSLDSIQRTHKALYCYIVIFLIQQFPLLEQLLIDHNHINSVFVLARAVHKVTNRRGKIIVALLLFLQGRHFAQIYLCAISQRITEMPLHVRVTDKLNST